MPDPSSAHPTDQALGSFVQGKLDLSAAEAVRRHLAGCLTCRARAEDVSAQNSPGSRPGSAQRPDSGPPAGSSLDLEIKNLGSASPDLPLQPETLPPGLGDLPDYRIIRELGRGGMGVVYLAHNQLMGRDEVLKVMGRHIIEKPGVLDRFLREIRAVARLQHPNIVTAYSAFRLPDSIVFAMEFVDGYDLSKLVKAKGPLSVAHATYFIQQAALGLQHAHEHGMVHRDIKPGNLMLSRKGDRAIVKVLDFGLAKATKEQSLESGLTQEGQMLGTPDYIAPEQTLDAQSADIRADIYSLGCTLYYLLKGGPPFQGSSLFEILQSHQSRDARPLDQLRTDVPPELTAVVSRMMAKQPENRFQTPAEVAKALAPFFKGGKTAAAATVTRIEPVTAVPSTAAAHSPVTPPSPSRAPRTGPPSVPPPSPGPAGTLIEASPFRPATMQEPTPFPAGTLIEASPFKPAAKQEPAVSPGRPAWMWPAVAAGVVLLAGLSTWASGLLSQKAPDLRTGQQIQAKLAQVPAGQGQPKPTIPAVTSPPASPPPVLEKTASREANTRSAGELASSDTGTAERTKMDERLRIPSSPERSRQNPARKPVLAPSRPVAVAAAEPVSPELAPLPPALGARATPFDLVRHAHRVLKELKYLKNPQKARIRNQAVLDLEKVIRNFNPIGRSLPQIIRIKKEIQPLEEASENPVNRDKLKEASDVLERAITMARGGKAIALREPSPRPAPEAGNEPVHEAVDSWQMNVSPVEFRLAAEGDERPPGWFSPELSAGNSQAWLVGDPAAIKLTNKGLSLEPGSDGNFLLTKRHDYTRCSITITLAAAESTEAYLALRAHQGPDGWQAITSRVACEGEKVRAGFASFDFQTPEHGRQFVEKPVGTKFMIRFEIDDKGADRVFISGKETSLPNHVNQQVRQFVGSVGLFVKSGKVLIESLKVAEK